MFLGIKIIDAHLEQFYPSKLAYEIEYQLVCLITRMIGFIRNLIV